ncbi:MAG: hypothetical protein AB8C84_12380 [Oligoflexales bacterium]
MDLFVDTTLYGYGIAGVKKGEVDPCFLEIDVEKRGSGVGGQLQKILNDHGIVWRDVEHIYISSGPGSFTGIKVGLSWAYGAQKGCEHKLKLAPYSGLQMVTQQSAADQLFILPSTRSRGFAAQQGVEPKPIDCETFEATGQKISIIGQWPEFEEMHPEAIVLDRETVLSQSLKAAIQSRARISVESNPQARYMRRSTAEENLK